MDSGKKRRQNRFLIKFWVVAILSLTAWYSFLQLQDKKFTSIAKVANSVVKILPVDQERKEELNIIFGIIPEIANEEEKTFLILFQNNNELRPGGGYIGAFGILKIKGEKVIAIDTHDTNVFDSGISTKIEPPFPMKDYLKVSDWELRDSNWSPDFATNAEKAEELYQIEGGEEELSGVVAISTKLLPSFLEITGPVSIPGFPGEYNSDNAIEKLQFQVEKGYVEQGIAQGKRKYIMKDLAKAILLKAQEGSLSDKKALVAKMEKHLNEKDVMINFKDTKLQEKIKKLGWNGELKKSEQDYLMMVDANMASYKTDQVIKRSFEYTADFSREKPRATLDIKYRHNGRLRNWYIKDYKSYLRIFVPDGSWLANSENLTDVQYGSEQDKKFFGGIINVPVGTIKTVSFSYDLPDNVTFENYKILIQKQSGIDLVKGKIKLIDENGKGSGYSVELKEDWEIEKEG
ncbi:DUF4012 domain-containing protein [bacterium]|nr:DUF4012 domain-containing protein [bacterium]MBT7431711.1 DUF4012 domain-containing protein [bacterium]